MRDIQQCVYVFTVRNELTPPSSLNQCMFTNTFSSANTLLSEVITYLKAGIDGAGPAPLWVAEQDVLGFEVSVQDAFALQDLHGLCNLLQEYADGVLT